MSDKQQKQPPHGWIPIRASASPMRGPNPRLMSPAPSHPRQRSPTPTFNARQLSETPTFNPIQPTPTPPLRKMPPTPTGFTTVYESQRFSPIRPQTVHPFQPRSQNDAMSPVNLPPDVSFPNPFRNTFSPAPSASTPCSIPPFSPPPIAHVYADRDNNVIKPISNDFYVVPLEPASHSKNVTIYDEDNETRPSTADIIAQQSQDYVDEKLAEYQATIMLLQGNFFFFTKINFSFNKTSISH